MAPQPPYSPSASTPVRPPATGSARVNVGPTERLLSAGIGGLAASLGLLRGGVSGIALALTGGALVYRGVSGHCPINEAVGRDTSQVGSQARAVEVHASVTVNRPRSEVYAMWRKLENLPRFMEHIEEVTDRGAGRSHWRARVPQGIGAIEWDAELVEEREGSALAWRSLPGADIDNAGVVRFQDAPGERGTEVHAQISYRPPAGQIGSTVGRWLDPVLSQMIKEDIRRFKHVAEAGEIPTIEGQPSGRD